MLTNKTNVAWSVLLAHMEGQVRQKREAGKQSTADQYRAVREGAAAPDFTPFVDLTHLTA